MRRRDPTRRILAVDLPGHGASPAQPPHDLPHVVELVHDALEAASVESPLVVGHSISGGLVGLYAARHATSGVVNVDQPPVIAPFARLVRSLEPRLRGSDFDATWREVFAASFHTELLPPQARHLVETTSHPSRDLVLSYWRLVLDRPVEQVEAMIDESMAEIARRRVPYLLLLGSEPPRPVLDHVRSRVPSLTVEVWPGTGHFPHLARPDEFAELVLRFLTGDSDDRPPRQSLASTA
jgi:pimeloyl-ACP methyl ester carboxylesterase